MLIQIPQANNTPITIYSYWRHPFNDFATYKRTFIECSHFIPVSTGSNDKLGNAVTFDAKLRIFNIGKFKTFSDFGKLSFEEISEYWTLNTGTPTGRDKSYVFVGNIPFEFVSGSVNDIDKQIGDRTVDGTLKYQRQYDGYRVESSGLRVVGSPRMHHVSINLKRMV